MGVIMMSLLLLHTIQTEYFDADQSLEPEWPYQREKTFSNILLPPGKSVLKTYAQTSYFMNFELEHSESLASDEIIYLLFMREYFYSRNFSQFLEVYAEFENMDNSIELLGPGFRKSEKGHISHCPSEYPLKDDRNFYCCQGKNAESIDLDRCTLAFFEYFIKQYDITSETTPQGVYTSEDLAYNDVEWPSDYFNSKVKTVFSTKALENFMNGRFYLKSRSCDNANWLLVAYNPLGRNFTLDTLTVRENRGSDTRSWFSIMLTDGLFSNGGITITIVIICVVGVIAVVGYILMLGIYCFKGKTEKEKKEKEEEEERKKNKKEKKKEKKKKKKKKKKEKKVRDSDDEDAQEEEEGEGEEEKKRYYAVFTTLTKKELMVRGWWNQFVCLAKFFKENNLLVLLLFKIYEYFLKWFCACKLVDRKRRRGETEDRCVDGLIEKFRIDEKSENFCKKTYSWFFGILLTIGKMIGTATIPPDECSMAKLCYPGEDLAILNNETLTFSQLTVGDPKETTFGKEKLFKVESTSMKIARSHGIFFSESNYEVCLLSEYTYRTCIQPPGIDVNESSVRTRDSRSLCKGSQNGETGEEMNPEFYMQVPNRICAKTNEAVSMFFQRLYSIVLTLLLTLPFKLLMNFAINSLPIGIVFCCWGDECKKTKLCPLKICCSGCVMIAYVVFFVLWYTLLIILITETNFPPGEVFDILIGSLTGIFLDFPTIFIKYLVLFKWKNADKIEKPEEPEKELEDIEDSDEQLSDVEDSIALMETKAVEPEKVSLVETTVVTQPIQSDILQPSVTEVVPYEETKVDKTPVESDDSSSSSETEESSEGKTNLIDSSNVPPSDQAVVGDAPPDDNDDTSDDDDDDVDWNASL